MRNRRELHNTSDLLVNTGGGPGQECDAPIKKSRMDHNAPTLHDAAFGTNIVEAMFMNSPQLKLLCSSSFRKRILHSVISGEDGLSRLNKLGLIYRASMFDQIA